MCVQQMNETFAVFAKYLCNRLFAADFFLFHILHNRLQIRASVESVRENLFTISSYATHRVSSAVRVIEYMRKGGRPKRAKKQKLSHCEQLLNKNRTFNKRYQHSL